MKIRYLRNRKPAECWFFCGLVIYKMANDVDNLDNSSVIQLQRPALRGQRRTGCANAGVATGRGVILKNIKSICLAPVDNPSGKITFRRILRKNTSYPTKEHFRVQGLPIDFRFSNDFFVGRTRRIGRASIGVATGKSWFS